METFKSHAVGVLVQKWAFQKFFRIPPTVQYPLSIPATTLFDRSAYYSSYPFVVNPFHYIPPEGMEWQMFYTPRMFLAFPFQYGWYGYGISPVDPSILSPRLLWIN